MQIIQPASQQMVLVQRQGANTTQVAKKTMKVCFGNTFKFSTVLQTVAQQPTPTTTQNNQATLSTATSTVQATQGSVQVSQTQKVT